MRVQATGFQADCPSNSDAKMLPPGDVSPKQRDVSDDERSTTASSFGNDTNTSDTHHSGSDSEGASPPRDPPATITVHSKEGSSSAWAHLRRLLAQLPCHRRASAQALAVDKAKTQACRRPVSSLKKQVELPNKQASKLVGKPQVTKRTQPVTKRPSGLGEGCTSSNAPVHSHVALLAQLEKRAGKTPTLVNGETAARANRSDHYPSKSTKNVQPASLDAKPLPPSFRPPPGLAPPPGLELPWDAPWRSLRPEPPAVAKQGQVELQAELQAVVTYTVQGFKKEIVLILRDLTLHKNVGQAVQQLRAQNVPKDRQTGEFVDILTRVMEERRGPQRRICIAFVAGACKAFGKEECIAGIAAFFKEVYDELLSEIPALNKFVATELVPTLRTVFSKEELDRSLPAGFSAALGGM